MHLRPYPRFTAAEYLALDDASHRKHEFIGGEIIPHGEPDGPLVRGRTIPKALDGGRHHAITANLLIALGLRLRGQPHRVFTGDQRLGFEDSTERLYPDLVVATAPFEFKDRDLLNPRLVVEVVSPVSEDYDGGVKLRRYRTIASVTDVLLVEQDTRRVEHHRRVAAETWMMQPVTEGAVSVESLGVELPLDEIYVDLDGLPTG